MSFSGERIMIEKELLECSPSEPFCCEVDVQANAFQPHQMRVAVVMAHSTANQ